MATRESLERRGFTHKPTFEGKVQTIRRKDKFYDKCQCPDCPEFFEVTNQRQRFCGNACRQQAFKLARKPIIQIEVPDAGRLTRIEAAIAGMQERLDRIEERLGIRQ